MSTKSHTMDMKKVNNAVEKLSGALKGMQKCLVCAICYDTLSLPVRTQCGHSFCRACLATLLSLKNAPCPLCKVNLTRRSFSDDKHTEICIEKTNDLALAICKDTGFNEFGQILKSKCTTESHPTMDSFVRRTSQFNISNTSATNNTQKKPKSVNPTGKRRGRAPKKLKKNMQMSIRNNATNISSRLSSTSRDTDITICNTENANAEDKTAQVEAWLDDLNYARNLNSSSKASLNKQESSKINTSSDSQMIIPSDTELVEEQLILPQILHSGSKQDVSIGNSYKENNFKQTEKYGVDHKKLDRTNTSKKNQVINGTNNHEKSGNKTKQEACSESSENSLDAATTRSLNMTKDTWSCVKTFGIDMRSKKKKLKSLNVSRETTGYLKASGSMKHQKVLDTMQSGAADNVATSELECSISKRKKTDNKVNEDSTSVTTGETVIRTDYQSNNQLNQATKNIRTKFSENNTVRENEGSIFNATDASSEPDKIKDTSFIMMEGGNLIRIQNLDDRQMKDIIGCTDENIGSDSRIRQKADSDKDDKSENFERTSEKPLERKDNEVLQGTRVDRTVLSLKRRSNSSTSVNSVSPTSSPIGSVRETLAKSFADAPNITQTPTKDSPILINTPLNTSGKFIRLKTDLDGSHQKPGSTRSKSLSLSSTARRNLTTEISNTSLVDIPSRIRYNKTDDQNKTIKNSTNDERKSQISERRSHDEGEETRKVTSLNENVPDMRPKIVNKYNMKSNESSNTKLLNRRSFVTFTKLGRVMKVRHVTSRFFYANRLSPERPLRTLSRLEQTQVYYQNIPIPNDNDIIWIPETSPTPNRRSAAVFTPPNESRRNVFSSKNTSTESGIYDETTFLRRVEQENAEPVEEENTGVVRSEMKTQESVDVIFVSLDKNQRCAQSQEALQDRNSINNCNTDVNDREKETLNHNANCKGVKAKILSPGKDSQLMFLSLESPLSDHREPKVKPLAAISETPSVTAAVASTSEIKGFPGARGTNSQALIRRSQEPNKNAAVEKGSTVSGETPMEVTIISSDSNNSPITDRKRKRIDQEQLHRINKKSKDDNTLKRNAVSSSSSESQVRYKDSSKLFDKKPIHGDSLKDEELPAESDLSKTEHEYDLHGRIDVRKKKYKRIVRASSSDTDSEDELSFTANRTDTRPNKGSFSEKQKFNKNSRSSSSLLHSASQVSSKVTEPWPTKRKRVDAQDSSSDDEDVNAIVQEWCSGLPTAQRFTKKSNESTKDTSVYKKSINPSDTSQSTPLTVIDKNARKSLDPYFKESSSMDFNCTGFAKTPSKERLEHANAENEPSDIRDQVIHDIIGRVRKMQKTDSDLSPRKDPKNNNSLNTVPASDRDLEIIQRENLMEDNFDEAIANMDTQALINASSNANAVASRKEGTEKITSIESPGKLNSNESPPSINKSSRKFVSPYKRLSGSPKACSSSDKENDKYFHDRVKNSLNEENARQNVQRREESQSGRKVEYTALSQSAERRVNTKLNSMEFNLSGDDNAESSQKDSLFEHDTIMNVTQYSKMLKQIEEDILGPVKPTAVAKKQYEGASGQLRKLEDSPRTPKRTGERARSKDMEQSGEDDIVESTPEVRTKSTLRGSSSSVTRNRETPVSSPLSGATTIRDSEYSPVREYLRTPRVQKGIFPLYQSTPKAPDVVANDKPISARKLVLVCSKLTPQEIERVKEFAEMCHGIYLSQFTRDVTHVIVKMDKENNATDRTLKYLQGVAHRKWIVGYDWVAKSLAQKCPADEEPYEAVDNGSLEAGPRNSRLREKGVFEGFAFVCVGSYTHMSIEQCQDLLRATGATIVETPEELAARKNRLKPIALFSDSDCDAPVEWYRELKIATVSESWIVDCISQFKVVSFASYLINMGVSELSSAYPEELLVEESESDVDEFDDETLQ